MTIWLSKVSLSEMTARGQHTMADFLGIEYIEVGEDFLKASMPVDSKTRQPMGIMHGGASCVLAETVGSTAAQYCVDRENYYCVGLDINTNHIRAVRSGLVIAIARPYHLGKSTQVWGIEIKNEEERLVSVNRLTMAVLKK